MSPGSIISWIQLAMLVLQYGREVVELAIEIYKKIEEIFAAVPSPSPAPVPAGGLPRFDKATTFNKEFVTAIASSLKITESKKVKAVFGKDKIRETVWKTRRENLGRKPGSG